MQIKKAKRKKFTAKYYRDNLEKYGLEKADMPICETCGNNKYTVLIGLDTFGYEFRCTKHRFQWAQCI